MTADRAATSIEPTPKGSGPVVGDLVKDDIDARMKYGVEKYGEALRPNNGRRTLRDAYQEALDLAIYLRQLLYESEGE